MLAHSSGHSEMDSARKDRYGMDRIGILHCTALPTSYPALCAETTITRRTPCIVLNALSIHATVSLLMESCIRSLQAVLHLSRFAFPRKAFFYRVQTGLKNDYLLKHGAEAFLLKTGSLAVGAVLIPPQTHARIDAIRKTRHDDIIDSCSVFQKRCGRHGRPALRAFMAIRAFGGVAVNKPGLRFLFGELFKMITVVIHANECHPAPPFALTIKAILSLPTMLEVCNVKR